MQTTRAANIHDTPINPILDPKIRRSRTNQLERRRAVQLEDRIPLLVRRLVDYAVPGKACVVDDDVDGAVAEFGGRFDELGDIFVVE